MKIIKLNESDLKRIIKRVISEQLVQDYDNIVKFIKNSGGEEVSKNKFEFKNPGRPSQYVEITDKIHTYTLNKGKQTDVAVLDSLDELKNLISPEN